MTLQNQEQIVPLFKQKRGNASIVLPNGRLVMFANGRFFTVEEDLIAHLVKMAKTQEAGVYIDPQESEIDVNAATPMEQERKKIRAQLLAELRANPSLLEDSSYGTNRASVLGVTSSTSAVPEGTTAATQAAPLKVSGAEDNASALSALEKLKSGGKQS